MRPIPGDTRNIIAGSFGLFADVHVEDPLGAWVALGNFHGANWLDEARWEGGIDASTESAIITLRREAEIPAQGLISLAPLMGGSPANQRGAGGTYAPLLAGGRGVRIWLAMKPLGETPTNADWMLAFDGEVDDVDSESSGDAVQLTARDVGARLFAFIEEERTYGSSGGVPVQTVMQAIINDNLAPDQRPTLYVPVDPGWNVHTFKQDRKPVLEALRDLAQQFGWDVRYRWQADGTYRLTLAEPQRTKTAADATFGPNEYTKLPRHKILRSDIRNRIRGTYFDLALGARNAILRTDPASISQYGPQFMEIQEAYTSNIDTAAEMTAMLDAILADVAQPGAEQDIETFLFPFVELGDLHEYLANAVHYDASQKLAVVGWKHAVKDGHGTTTFTTRGKPAGAWRRWLRTGKLGTELDVDPGLPAPVLDARIIAADAGSVTYRVSGSAPDGRAVSLFLAAGNNDFPGTSNITNPQDVTVLRGSAAAEDRVVRVMARTADGQEDRRTLIVDFDEAPEVVAISPATPTYEGGQQTGWEQRGSVDDDTRSLCIYLPTTGLAFVSSTPTAQADYHLAGRYWLDTTSVKTFVVRFSQGPGQVGTVGYEPYDANRDVFQPWPKPGRKGPLVNDAMRRAAVTTFSQLELSPTSRRVSLSVNPTSATIYYRVDGSTYFLAANGGSVSFTVDVATADRVVEFYSVSQGGAIEEMQRVTLDRDDAPTLTSLNVSETAASVVTVSVGLDEDIAYWRAWARRGNWPTDENDEPVDDYLKFAGTRQRTSFAHRAEGTGADPGSRWFYVVRGYDYLGRFHERTAEVVVQGAPPSGPHLSNVRVTREQHGGSWYNVIRWDNNAVVEAGGYVVRIIENQAEPREISPYEDGWHDARFTKPPLADEGANRGSYSRQKLVQPDPNTGTLVPYTYEIQLVRSSDGGVERTYFTGLTERYRGTGHIVPHPDAQYTPTTPAIAGPVQNEPVVQLTWSTGSEPRFINEDRFHVEVWHNPTGEEWAPGNFPGDYTLADDVEVGRFTGTHTFHQLPSPGGVFRGRYRLRNALGDGAWSPLSAALKVTQ